MKGYIAFIIAVVLLVLLLWTAIGVVTDVAKENEILKSENQMLKTALEDLGAKIEELSNTVDILRRELERSDEWNEGVANGM